MKTKKVLFLLPYPLHNAPSQRFRMEAFFPLLKQNNIEVHTQTFLDANGWKILYKNGSVWQKIRAVAAGFVKRWWATLFLVWRYDFIVVHREAAPLGPPVFEWIIGSLWKRKMIFDFDDAIWIPAVSEQNKLASFAKCFWKTKWICKWSYRIAAGNQYLAEFARRHNPNVFVIPTCVDTNHRYNSLADHETQKPSIGWTGSHSTIKYLDTIVPVLQKLEKIYDFDFYVICNKKPAFQLNSLKYIEWKEDTEIEDLKNINIGLMPLEEDLWSQGKCGFKIIQYMALGIPAVASPVGVNNDLINKSTGFLCSTPEQWYTALSTLLSDDSLRVEMGKNGRDKIIRFYSIQANAGPFLSLFD